MVVGMLLETLGMGAIIPALALMENRDLAATYPTAKAILAYLGNPTQPQLIIGGLLTLFAIYTVKAGFLAFLIWRQARLVADVRSGLSQRLFDGYLSEPWTFHLERNSAQLIRNAINEVEQFSSAAASALLMLTESLILAGVGILLFVVEPIGSSVVVIVLGMGVWGYQRIMRGDLLRWGQGRFFHDGQRFQHLQEGLGGVKEIKLLGREAAFSERYRVHNVASTTFFQRHQTAQQLPRLMFELLAIAGLVILGIVLIGTGKPASDLLPVLGLFAAAAFRLLPSINRLVNAGQSIRFTLPTINTLYEEIRILPASVMPSRGAIAKLRDKIELVDVSFRYPNAQSLALSNVTLCIAKGSTVGFVGGSGAGKSTLVDVILGLLSPCTGQVQLDGTDISQDLRGWQDQIGYVPQHIFLTDDTLRRNVAFGVPDDQIDDLSVQRAIRTAQLEEFVAGLPRALETMVGERGVRLSGGQRQRIGVARALYHDPDVLVLDEATSALDMATEQNVMEAVNLLKRTKTILIVAHRLSTLAHCDRLYRLERGAVVDQGTYADVSQATLAQPVALDPRVSTSESE